MEDELAVRVILSAGKDSIRYLYSLLKSKLNTKAKIARFTDSEVLNESLASNIVAVKALKREYKINGVDFFSRKLPDGKMELLFHAKDRNMILATTEKIMRDMQENPQKYLKKETVLKPSKGKKEPTLKEEIQNAKQIQQELLKNAPTQTVNKTIKKGKSL
ncbi:MULTISPECIES: hypothetical protein [Enterococcus]|uniref:hypothetical protein n=1 Tax=Enterococcus TaxID=1350 RepID=UPI001473BACB|nr:MULTISPECIES: hypothetical protein [Enterococcus]MCI5685608.1 hypothetical protein [Enterococcus gallinarum]MCO5478309.1 hypothetical protein [Enterococcus gallinarum]MDN6949213.1 hypothetical protein [Enterococcus faecium]MDV7822124.1 hypothetical protein [Enterococcus gallinarum]MDV7873293.1 hypothetical protein [Enterococcus gallinarum]